MAMEDENSANSIESDLFSRYDNFEKAEGIVDSFQLPINHDSSWIGARLSPIAFHDGNEERKTAKDRRTIDYSSATERSSLLGKKSNPDRLHLWNDLNTSMQQSVRSSGIVNVFQFINLVWLAAGFELLCMAMHDLYLFYLSYRQGSEIDVEKWTLPWISPSPITLQRFGAFIPYRVIVEYQLWRFLTSTLISTSFVEWILVLWSWKALHWKARPTKVWSHIYILSVFTGHLWMMAFDSSGQTGGGAVWGTCGVICAVGGAKPGLRFILFLTAIVSVFVSLLAPTNSVMGAISGSFFGWSFYGLGWSPVVSKNDKDAVKPTRLTQAISCFVLIKLWAMPIIFMAFRDPVITLMIG